MKYLWRLESLIIIIKFRGIARGSPLLLKLPTSMFLRTSRLFKKKLRLRDFTAHSLANSTPSYHMAGWFLVSSADLNSSTISKPSAVSDG